MQCQYIKETGEQCQASALAGSDRCFFHDPRPEIAKERLKAQKRGGRKAKQTVSPAPRLNLKDIKEIPSLLDEALYLRLTGLLSLKDGEYVRKMALAALDAHKVLSVEAKTEELLRRIKTERNRPVDPAEVEDLLRFAQDDADEIAQAIADSDDAGQQNGSSEADRNNGGPAHQPGHDAGQPGGARDSGARVGHHDGDPAGGHEADAEANPRKDVDKVGGPDGEPTR